MLELAGKEDQDEAFLDCRLDQDDRDHSQHHMRGIRELEELLQARRVSQS